MNLTTSLGEIKTNCSTAHMVVKSSRNVSITIENIYRAWNIYSFIFIIIENVNIFDKKNILIVCSTGEVQIYFYISISKKSLGIY